MTRVSPTVLLLPIVLSIQVTAAFPQQSAERTELVGFDSFIASVMKEWEVPGVAIAVVKEGKVILAQGHGYRDVENKLPVTPRTLFAIGSITKSFTVTALGMLADEDKLDWDKAVRTYLPDFQLHDAVATEHMTPRDLVTHRSGLPRHDGLWYGSSFSREEMYARLRHLEPSKEFRNTFQYNNLMFMTAGYLAGKLAGRRWEDLVRERIFEPLGMRGSNFSVDDSQKAEDFALPYMKLDDKVERVPFRNLDAVGPAGSINSCVEEMIRYVQFHVGQGKHGDAQLLSRNGARAMQTPQMVMPGGGQYDEVGYASYGLGFVVSSYRGHKLVQHGGGIDGFISLLSFLPRERMGMIILTNFSGNNPVPTILTYSVFDRLLGLEQTDWAGRMKEQRERAERARKEAEEKRYSDRKQGTSPSHPLPEYAGSYEHPGYGAVSVEVDGSDLRISFNGVKVLLSHYHYDLFEVAREARNPLRGAKVMFSYDKKGDIDRIAIPLERNVDDIVFRRAADESMRQKEFLEQLVGEYVVASTTVTVALKGEDTLTLVAPGQPTYTLVPRRGTTFDLKGLNGFSVEFKKDASGAVTELVSYQPNGTFVARKKRRERTRVF